MAFIVPDQGERYALKKVLSEIYYLRLYTNNISPAEKDEAYEYVESNGQGYKVVSLEPAKWKIETINGITSAIYPECLFTYTNSDKLYGFFITNQDKSILLGAERFTDGPYDITTSGAKIAIQVILEQE